MPPINSSPCIPLPGLLRTATTFDYESNASNYTIQVLARDEFNATVEGNFTITLTDLYEPLVGSVPFRTSIRKLELWLDANDLSHLYTGGLNITEWRDKIEAGILRLGSSVGPTRSVSNGYGWVKL